MGRHTDTQKHGKTPIRVLMYRRNPKNAKKRSPQTDRQTDRQTHGKPPIRVLMYKMKKKRKMGLKRSAGACEEAGTVEGLLHRRNPKNAKKRNEHTHTQTDGKPPIRVLMYKMKKKRKMKLTCILGAGNAGSVRRRLPPRVAS